MKKVAVIIVHYNTPEITLKTLQGLEQQTRMADKVILLDNNSTKKLPLNLDKQYTNLQIINSKKNLGFAAGNNLAINHVAEYDWIILLNPDAVPEPNWLANCMLATTLHPEYDFFACRMLIAQTPELLDGTGDCYNTSGFAYRRDHQKPADKFGLTTDEVFSPCGAAAMYKTKVYLNAGGLDENYFCYHEDVDLGFRLQIMGHKCLYLPNATVHHVGSAVTIRHSDFYVYHGHRNLVWTYFKNMPSWLFWFYLPKHLALNLYSLYYFARKKQFKIIVKAKWDAIKGLKRVLQQRKNIQRQRKVSLKQIKNIFL